MNLFVVMMCVVSCLIGVMMWLVIMLIVSWEDSIGYFYLFFVGFDLLFVILFGICLYFVFIDESVLIVIWV